MYEGVVKWFNDKKGFGFISDPQGGDIFLHCSEIADRQDVHQGDRVRYELARGEKGLKAVKVCRE